MVLHCEKKARRLSAGHCQDRAPRPFGYSSRPALAIILLQPASAGPPNAAPLQ